jgi:Fur family peroxide stress response transcriptional regulator
MIHPETRYSEVIGKLKKRGRRITPQRAAILRMLIESQDHPTVEQIYDHIRLNYPMTSLATIYKTIMMLKDENEILEISFANESSRYDGHKPYPHPHLICIRCRRIIDPETSSFDEAVHQVEQKYGYQITSQRIDFFGICPQCLSSPESSDI